MSRYEFLAKLHQFVEPAVYMEIGVQTGASLSLAEPPTLAIGIDPSPVLSVSMRTTYDIYKKTSDEYFASREAERLEPIELGFIDGMHLAEFALRDFFNMEHISSPRGIILFDDVLPYNRAIATRHQPPGDWTGDVWKVYPYLRKYRRDLNLRLINVAPTGLLMVTGLNPEHKETQKEKHFKSQAFWLDQDVPDEMLNRVTAQSPEYVLQSLAEELGLP